MDARYTRWRRETKNRYRRVPEEGRREKIFWTEDGHRPRDVTHRGRRHRRPTLSISVTVLAARRLIDDRRDGNDISWNAVVVADHFFFLFHVRSTTALPLSLSLSLRSPLSLFVSLIFSPLPFFRARSLCPFSFFFPSLPSLPYIVFISPLEINAIRFLTAIRLVFARTLGAERVYHKSMSGREREKKASL